MNTMCTGYTKDLTQQERDENELQAIEEILKADPINEYWLARFEEKHAVEQAYQPEHDEAAEIGEITQWLGQESTSNFEDDMADYLDLKATQEDARLS